MHLSAFRKFILPFYKLQKQRVGNMRKQGQSKDDMMVCDQAKTPKCGMAHDFLGIVEKSINASIQ